MEPQKTLSSDITFPVQGMSCGSCVRHIKTALERDYGIYAVEVNLAAARVTVSYNPQVTEPAVIAAAIRKSGYTPGDPQEE